MSRLSLDEVVERLQSPYAPEALTPLGGSALLVVDCRAPLRVAREALAVAGARLAALACPTVAIANRPTPLLDRVDVLVSSEDELAPILDVVTRAPLAAMTLAQLLRHSLDRDIGEGLLAESLAYSTLQGGPEFAAWRAGPRAVERRGTNGEPAVLVERDGERLSLVLNRPARRNALSVEIRDALVDGLRFAESDVTITEIVLRGNGPAFCAGGDLDEFGTLNDPATAHAVRSVRGPARALVACAERVTAEVHGACVGAGIELPAFARRVVAKPGAFFQLPEVGMGLVPGAGGTVSIPRRIGRQRTAYLCLSGMRLDAETALAWGLVDEIR